MKEAGFQDDILKQERAIEKPFAPHPRLSVRVATPAAAKAAIVHGADAVYVGGEAFRPAHPWTLADYQDVLVAAEGRANVLLNTPRTTMRRECGELEQFFTGIQAWERKPDGILVSNLGSLKLAQTLTDLPVQADVSFNLFNHMAVRFLKENGLTMACASLELSFEQLREIVETSELPIEVIVHGSYESMICDHDFIGMNMKYNELDNPELLDRHFALKDRAGEVHRLRIDQFGRTHIYFANDLCLYPYLQKMGGLASYRIEAQDYDPDLTAAVTRMYRKALDELAAGRTISAYDEQMLDTVKSMTPRVLGIGTFRFRESRNSI